MDERGNIRNRWLTAGMVVVLILLFLWVMAAYVLGASAADGTTVLLSLRSKLTADYSEDRIVRPLPPFRLSIITEAMHDQDPAGSVEGREPTLKSMMDEPVPTATAQNFEGKAPFTPTSTPLPQTQAAPSKTPGDIPPPSPTPSPLSPPWMEKEIANTPGMTATFGWVTKPPPSKTPTPFQTSTAAGTWTSTPASPTPEPEPSATSAPPTATETAPPSKKDLHDPVIEDWSVIPKPGKVWSCSPWLKFTHVRVRDPRHSQGIDWARLKYNVNGRSCYLYSKHLIRTSTFFDCAGGRCEIVAKFTGHLYINLDKYFANGNCGSWPDEDNFKVNVWIQARDDAGHVSQVQVGTYRLPDDVCAEND